MRRALGGVVTVGREVTAVLRRVAGDDIPLHPRHFEVVYLLYFRGDPALDTRLDHLYQFRVADIIVLSPLVLCIRYKDRFSFDLSHEARLLPSMLFIKADQTPTEIRLEYIRQNQDRCGNFETC